MTDHILLFKPSFRTLHIDVRTASRKLAAVKTDDLGRESLGDKLFFESE